MRRRRTVHSLWRGRRMARAGKVKMSGQVTGDGIVGELGILTHVGGSVVVVIILEAGLMEGKPVVEEVVSRRLVEPAHLDEVVQSFPADVKGLTLTRECPLRGSGMT